MTATTHVRHSPLQAAIRDINAAMARRRIAAERALEAACEWVRSPEFIDSPDLLRIRLEFEARRAGGRS